MTRAQVRRKWRPPLALVIGGTLAVVLSLPILGVTWLRLAGNILGWAETGWLIGWIAVAATVVLAWLLWRLVLRPVWALTAHAQAMARSGTSDPPTRFGTAELGDLGASVIEMGESLHARARSLSAYADHVTHELKSPLTSLRGAADLLKDETLAAEDRMRLLSTIETSVSRAELLLNDLRAHAAARLDVAAGTTTARQALAAATVPEGLEVDVRADETLPISTQDLARVLTQLAGNAAAHGATTVWLSAGPQTLEIEDNGRGVRPGDRDRVFDPFFTTRRADGGTGMGLTIVRTLIEAAGGTIALRDTRDGAAFRVSFLDIR